MKAVFIRLRTTVVTLFTTLIAGCGSAQMPSINVVCVNDAAVVEFKTDEKLNALVGSDGTQIAYYSSGFRETHFMNFGDSGSRDIVNSEEFAIYKLPFGDDHTMQITDKNDISTFWKCRFKSEMIDE